MKMKLQCRSTICQGYVWTYNGKKAQGERTSCPKCGGTVRIRPFIESEVEPVTEVTDEVKEE